jgi:hypothetical protein
MIYSKGNHSPLYYIPFTLKKIGLLPNLYLGEEPLEFYIGLPNLKKIRL